MKSLFSKNWIRSKKPRKQRKYVYNAPLHIKSKFLSSPLSKELKEKYGRRNVVLRRGDTVRIMRGSHSGSEGKVDFVFPKKGAVFIEGFEKSKGEGSKSRQPFKPSNLMIVTLDLSDKIRKEKLTPVGKKEDK